MDYFSYLLGALTSSSGGSSGGTAYSSIDYDAATNTYTLTEAEDNTITHTLTCSYDAQGKINGMVYDSKAIAVTYNNDGTVTVGGAVVDVSEYEGGGTELNIGYGDTAPEDTTKLWVKTAQPQNVTADYDIDNGVESVQQISATLPNNESTTSCGVVGTKCYLFGGTRKNGQYMENVNTICVFDTETETLATLSGTLPRAEQHIGVGVVGTKCYLFGGDYGGSYENTIRVFDTTTNTLSTLTATLPTAAKGVSCGVVGTKIYLFGGLYAPNASGRLNTICVFDTETETVSTLSATLPSATWGAGVGVVGTKIYLFCGVDAGSHAVWEFDTTTNTISTLAASLPEGNDVAVATFGTKCYIFGVKYFQSQGEIYMFDADTKTVSTITAAFPQKNISLCYGSGIVGEKCYLFGGYSVTSSAFVSSINKFTVTFPLNEGDVYIQTDVFKNKFTLVTAPTEVKTGVSAVYVGNASNEAEYCEARLYDNTSHTWEQIT